MANIEIPFVPIGGLNQDDSEINPTIQGSPFEQGDYRYALNLRLGASRTDSLDSGEVLKSSLEITGYKVWNGSAWVNGTRPSGENFPIGQLEDKQLRKIFLAFWSSIGEHTICYNDTRQNVMYELIRWDGLNFGKRYLSMSRIGDYLVFANIDNKPRIINYKTIHVLKATLGVKFTEYHISFSKWAPLAPPVTRYYENAATPASYVTKDLEKLLLQFTYRYVYVGGFYSAWSPISNTCSNLYLRDINYLNSVMINIPGLIGETTALSAPKGHNDQEFYEVVQFIEIAYRVNQLDNWKIFKRWPVTKSPDTTATDADIVNGVKSNNSLFAFNAKIAGAVVDTFKDYDEVPLKSNCVEVIDNRVMFGNNLDEHDFVSDNDFIENVAVYQTDQIAWYNYTQTFGGGKIFSSLSDAGNAFLCLKNKLSIQSFKSRGVYKFALEFKDETGKKTLLYTTDKWIASVPEITSPNSAYTDYFTAVGWNFKSSFVPPDWAYSYQILRTNCLNISYFIYGFINSFQLLVDDATPTDDLVTNPTRSVISNYFDVTNPQLSLYQRLIAETRKTKSTVTLANASRIYLDINNWINAAKNTGTDVNFPLNKIYYDYRQGDRVRFWGKKTGASDYSIFDVPIIEYTGRGILIEKPKDLASLGPDSESASRKLIEVYRPKEITTNDDLIFYEMGEWYPILNPGRPNRDFSKKDWRWVSVGGVTDQLVYGHYVYNNLPCYAGDVHAIKKDYYYNYINSVQNGSFLDVFAFSMNPDRDQVYEEDWEKNNGRPNTLYVNQPLVAFKETQIRFGAKYLQDSIYNGINTFDSNNQFIYPQEYGAIRELINTTSYQVESVGSILLVLAENKPWSVYVNRTTLEDLGGRTQFFLSDKVLGSYNSLLREHGCFNPESVSFSDNGNVYWWSQLNGSWVRYGRDGTTAISDEYDMNSWFKEISQILEPFYNETQAPWVISIYDSFNRELLTCFTKYRSNDYDGDMALPASFRGYDYYLGSVFNEDRNQWKWHHSYEPQIFTKMNNDVYAFRNNKFYLLEGGTDYRNMLGNIYPSKLECVFNPNVRQSKSWQTIAILATHKWSVERTLSEYLGDKTQQESFLLLNKFDQRENMYYSEFMMDKNSGSDPDLAVGQGNKLRSRILKVLINLDPDVTTKSLLHQIIVGFIESPKNVKV